VVNGLRVSDAIPDNRHAQQMRVSHVIFSFLLLLGSGALAWVLGDAVGQKLSPSRAALETHSYDWISDIEAYHDKDFGFRMAVPAGWQAIDMSIDYESEQDGLAIAHSVGFEAPATPSVSMRSVSRETGSLSMMRSSY